MKQGEKYWYIILAGLCLVYILLRFWHLTDSCLLFDEIFSVHAAGHDWQNLLWFIAQDLIHPPFFYVLLKCWIYLNGESLFWIRFFPVLFSVISLIPFYLLCRQLKLNCPTIALALTFLAVNGSLIKYAQEVRMYSLLMCLSLFSMWLLARFLNVGKGIWVLTFINILLVYTHYFGWLAVLAEVFAVLILQRLKIRQIFIMVGLTIFSFVPWFIAVFQAARFGADVSQNLGWAAKPDVSALFQFLFNLSEPFYYKQSNLDAFSIYWVTIPLLMVFFTAFVFYCINWKTAADKEKNAFYFLLIFIAIPFLLAFTASWLLPFSIWGTHHLIIVFAPAAILSAKILNAVNNRRLQIILPVFIILSFALAFRLHIQRGTSAFIWCAWANLVSGLSKSEPAKIYVFEDDVAYQTWFALRESGTNFQIIKVNEIPGLAEDKGYFLPRDFDAVQMTDANGIEGDQFWIAFRDTDFDYLKQPLQTLIEKGYRIGDPKVFEAQGLKAYLVKVSK